MGMFLFVVLSVTLLILSGCSQQEKQPAQSEAPQTQQSAAQSIQQSQQAVPSIHRAEVREAPQTLKGVSLSPKSFESVDFTDFFEKARQTGSVVLWAGDWNDLSNTQNSGPAVVGALAGKYSFLPIIEAQFFTQSDGKLIRPLDAATKKRYKDSAATFAGTFRPGYMGFGIEVNTLYEKSPEDFENFVQFFSEIYDAIKSASPDTNVFTVFQLEKMKGMQGGLFGGTNDVENAEWQLLGLFPKSDIIAFTTYPGLIYKDPSEMPDNYYSVIVSHTSKPIAFTEIGWHSSVSISGWESSEAEQAAFIRRFFALTDGLNAEMVVWSFMYDQDTTEPFSGMGLRNRDGSAKAAWEDWTNEN